MDAADSFDLLDKEAAVAKIIADIQGRGSDWRSWLPAYPGEHRRVARAAIPQPQEVIAPEAATSLLSPDIDIVVAIDFDNSIAFDWTHVLQWSMARFSKSWGRPSSGRALQFNQRILAAKPHHPILVDTLATVVELLEDTSVEKRQPVSALQLRDALYLYADRFPRSTSLAQAPTPMLFFATSWCDTV